MAGTQAVLLGVPKVLARLHAVGIVGRALSGDELRSTVEAVASKARRLVPVDTGALRNSIQTEHDTRKLRSEVGAGDTAVDYAVKIHEDTLMRHKNGQPLYIKQPFDQEVEGFEGRLKRRIRTAFRGA